MSTQQGVKLHLKEVVTTVLHVLDAGSHELRRQGADALTEVLTSVVRSTSSTIVVYFVLRGTQI